MIEAEFGVKAAQAHALLAELAAYVSADTSAALAVEVLPEILGAVRQADLLTCRRIDLHIHGVDQLSSRPHHRRRCDAMHYVADVVLNVPETGHDVPGSDRRGSELPIHVRRGIEISKAVPEPGPDPIQADVFTRQEH